MCDVLDKQTPCEEIILAPYTLGNVGTNIKNVHMQKTTTIITKKYGSFMHD